MFRPAPALALGLLVLGLGLSAGRGQGLLDVAPENLPPPRPVPRAEDLVVPDEEFQPAEGPRVLPIDLPTALRLAQSSNLDIALAREFVTQVEAQDLRARALALPNLSVGSAYNFHTGQIQRTEGNIITVNRDSLFLGGGPSLSWQLADVIFAPLVLRQTVAASQASLQRVSNDTMLAVADAYFNVLRARRRVARVQETLEQLTSERPSPARANSKGLLPLVRDFVEVGGKEAFRSDLERVRVEVLRRDEELRGAVQELETATAELARLLHIDARVPLWPTEDFRYPLALPGEAWFHQPVDVLVEEALNNRPELAENRALVEAAVLRVKAAQWRPLLPQAALTYNWGDFGGGPDPNPNIVTRSGNRITTTAQAGFQRSGVIYHFSTRGDFDASLFWRLQNLGFGNAAEVREQKALEQQAATRLLQFRDRVVAQVVQADESVRGWWDRFVINRSALFDEHGRPDGPAYKSLRLNFDRIRGAEGRPLEVQDSIRGLSDVLEAYGQAATDYERARFRLLVALGVPAEAFIDPARMPAPAAPEKCPEPVVGEAKGP